MRREIGKRHGVWISPTSPRTAYRTYAEQEYFWDQHVNHGGPLAARPGTSNHGWGIAVDVPTTRQAILINRYGEEYGWQKKWSDAPNEWWHFRYDEDHDAHRDDPAVVRKHPYHVLVQKEKDARNCLVRERRIARRGGGWEKVHPSHLKKAQKAKDQLRQYMRVIEREAQKTGWQRANRRRRFDYMQSLVGD